MCLSCEAQFMLETSFNNMLNNMRGKNGIKASKFPTKVMQTPPWFLFLQFLILCLSTSPSGHSYVHMSPPPPPRNVLKEIRKCYNYMLATNTESFINVRLHCYKKLK